MVYTVDPLMDSRWDDFVAHQSSASVFHSSAWLRALKRTYRYDPVAFTTSRPSESLRNAIVFCRIKSWLTGERIVSVPFSDHCEFLAESDRDVEAILRFLLEKRVDEGWKYIELRPVIGHATLETSSPAFYRVNEYCLHLLDLRPSLDNIFESLHKDSAQRRIRHAERAGLDYERGNNAKLLKHFYDLFVGTRRHHGLPPQPYSWFANLAKCMGDGLQILLASQNARPLAAVLTLKFKGTAYYKYGASDSRFHKLAATPFLFWKMIQEAKLAGASYLDLGRSDLSNRGLIAFKGHWTRTRVPLFYWRFPAPQKTQVRVASELKFAKQIFAHTPRAVLIATGSLAYRHIG